MTIENSTNKSWINSIINSTSKNWSKAFSRFPLFIVGAAVLCSYLSYLQSSNTISEKIIMPLILAMGGILAAYLFNENHKVLGIKKWLGFLLAITLALVYYYILPDVANHKLQWTYIAFCSILFIIHLIYAVIPFFKINSEESFLRYNVNVLENFVESAFLSLLLYGLLCLAIYAIKNLFDLNMSNDFFMHLFIWIAGFVHTINFLSNYPELPLQSENLNKYGSRFFKILTHYIGIPVIIIYGFIILAYAVKIIIGSDFKPWISSMCTWYISIGLLVYLFNRLYLIDNSPSNVSILFNKYFHKASLPIVILFTYSGWKNIKESGITYDNYYLSMNVVFALFIFIGMAFKNSFNLKLIPYALIALALFSILSGPFNSWTLPLKNQQERLINMLQEAGWIENGSFNLNQKSDVKDAYKIEQAIYNIDSHGELNFLKTFDKKHLLPDTILSYELIDKLKLQSHQSPKAMDNKYYESLPVIDVSKNSKIYPIANNYIALKNDYTGVRVSGSGKILVYDIGLPIDSIVLKIDQIGHQKISCSTLIKKDSFDIYIASLTFEKFGEICKVEDLMGVVVKK